MADDAKTAARNARLDALVTATNDWAQKQTDLLNAQVALNKRILKGRTGSERLAQTSVEASSSLTVDEINQFLTG